LPPAHPTKPAKTNTAKSAETPDFSASQSSSQATL
jgi:hypothetical protein